MLLRGGFEIIHKVTKTIVNQAPRETAVSWGPFVAAVKWKHSESSSSQMFRKKYARYMVMFATRPRFCNRWITLHKLNFYRSAIGKKSSGPHKP